MSATLPTVDVVDHMARLWRELRRGASTAVVRDRMFGTGDEGIEPGHMDVLDLLQAESPRRMSDLASALRVDPSTVTRAIQRMEADGLVERSPSPDDGRGVRVAATDLGRQRWAEVAARRRDIVREVLIPLSEDDQRRLVELLDRFVTSLHLYVGVIPRPAAPSDRPVAGSSDG